jgi:kinesin family protein 11
MWRAIIPLDSNIKNSLKAAGSLVEVMVREAQTYIENESKSVLQANAITESTVNNEVTRLRQQNEILARLLETERARRKTAKDELIQRVSNLLGDFTQERDTALMESIAAIQGSNVKGGETGRWAYSDDIWHE